MHKKQYIDWMLLKNSRALRAGEGAILALVAICGKAGGGTIGMEGML